MGATNIKSFPLAFYISGFRFVVRGKEKYTEKGKGKCKKQRRDQCD
jgi:hypothetical protein